MILRLATNQDWLEKFIWPNRISTVLQVIWGLKRNQVTALDFKVKIVVDFKVKIVEQQLGEVICDSLYWVAGAQWLTAGPTYCLTKILIK